MLTKNKKKLNFELNVNTIDQSISQIFDENNNDNENDDDNSNNHDNNDDINNFQEGSLLNVEFNDATRKACATYLDLLANTALSFIQSEVRCCD